MHHYERRDSYEPQLNQLFKVELNDQASFKPALNLGCAATNLLANLMKKDLVEEQIVLSFNKKKDYLL